MSLEALVEISRYYGQNPDYTLAGGGNTSWKEKNILYVKASGTALAEATPDSFVKMDRPALCRIWEKKYPEPDAADPFGSKRESAVLADMMAAGEKQKRPSVEALLHDILPFSYVVHLHPALVNGLTCSIRGKETMPEIFAGKAVWVAPENPGYALAKTVKTAMEIYGTKPPQIIFLQNHGVFVGDDSTGGIKELYGEIMHKIGAWIKRRPDFSDISFSPLLNSCEIKNALEEISSGYVSFMTGGEISALVKGRVSFACASSAFTPDHIVYSGSCPLFVEANADLREAWKSHVTQTGRNPKIIAVQGLGVFSAAKTEKAAKLALDLFRNAIEVAIYSESFGGPRFMTQDKIDFINNWEAESYRSNVST